MAEHLDVTLTMRDERAQLRLSGELDMAAVSKLVARLDEACSAMPSLLLIDLSNLTYCDSSGIRTLLRAAARCEKQGTDIRVTGATPAVRRVFELTDTTEVLHFNDDGRD